MDATRLAAKFFLHDVTADRMLAGRAKSFTTKEVLYIQLTAAAGERGHVCRAATEADKEAYAAEYEAFLHPEPDPEQLKAALAAALAEIEALKLRAAGLEQPPPAQPPAEEPAKPE